MGKQYASYMKFLIEFKSSSDLINQKMSEVGSKARSLSVAEILKNYEYLDSMIT